MENVEQFLAYAARLEQEAALRFDELADAATSFGKADVVAFFRQMAEFSRLHLDLARQRGGFHDLPDIASSQFKWPGSMGESPEATAIWGADSLVDVNQALALALEAEKRGLAFYQSILDQATDPEIRVMAKEFVEEEAEHVASIERWIARAAA